MCARACLPESKKKGPRKPQDYRSLPAGLTCHLTAHRCWARGEGDPWARAEGLALLPSIPKQVLRAEGYGAGKGHTPVPLSLKLPPTGRGEGLDCWGTGSRI